MRTLAFLSALFLPAVAMAKPLYITVPRTYATTEQAQVNVSFSGKDPVELRILKPDAIDKFMADQANLRRAYVEPSTLLNPGRYVSQGVNQIGNPGSFLYYAMSDSFRKAVAPSLPERPAVPRDLQRLREGPTKLVSNPPGMTLVKSEWLNLDLGGDIVDFNVPGFEVWGGASGYQERTVSLSRLPAGLYVLQLVQGTIEGQVTLVITDQTVQVKQTDGRLLVRVAGRDQKPIAGAQISVFAPGKTLASGATDKDGEVMLTVSEPKVLVLSKNAADLAVIDTDFYSTLAIAPDVFIYSDRPIYKPNDEVQFRGVVRKPSSFLAEMLLPRKRTVEVQMQLQGNDAPLKTTASIDEFGSFSGKIRVPKETPTGVVRLIARVEPSPKEGAEHQAEARVQDYVKPTFYLELTSEQEGIKPGEKLSAKIKARRYAGGVPKGAKYEYFLYRTQLETGSWVDDSGRGGQGSAVTYGSQASTEGKLSVPKRLFSSLQRMDNAQPEADPWETAAAFDDKGEATIEVEVPALEPGEERLAFRYSLSVRARDEQKSEAVGSKSFFLSDSDVVAQVGLAKKLFKKGEEATVAVRAQTLSGRSFGAAEGTITFLLRDATGEERKLDEKPLKIGEDGVIRVPLPTKAVGSIIARAQLKDKKGRANDNETEALIIGESGEAVAKVPTLLTQALGDALEPGATAELAALFPEGWGIAGRDTGSVWITLSGADIYETKRLDHSGRTLVHHFEIEKRFGSVVYASIAYPTASGRWDERTAAFRIVPKTRVLNVRVEPGRAEVSPLAEQTVVLRVTNSDGEGVPASVSLGIVDKAVYALQAEFRPNVVDFFYPVGRNNVSNFYSMEFQGYGYGEYLARAKIGLRPYEFAAVKPPSRKSKDLDRDTAYWSPEIITGRDGSATVSFKMPSNQTLWVATAVAADASGRFGEGRAEFASRGNLSLSLALPQFMRAGDEAQGSVRVALGSEGKAGQKVNVALAATPGVTAFSQEITLAKGDEQVLPVTVKATETGALSAQLEAKFGSESLRDEKWLAVRPAAIEEKLAVSAYGGGELALPAGADRLLEPAELTLMPGSVDAALASVEELLTYPFGCLEQLVATTVPNIALYHLLQKSQALGKMDPQTQSLMQLARSRAVQGTERILALAQKGGGFTWFSGYTDASVPLTLIALDGLSYAVAAGVISKDTPAIVESAKWVGEAPELPFALDATRTYVLARIDGAKAAPRVRQFVDKVEPTNDLYSLAITALAANAAGIGNEAGLKERLALIVGKSKQLLTQTASYDSAFYSYPMRQVGLSAIVAHASSGNISDADLKDARKRFVQAVASTELSTFDRSTLLLHHLWLMEKDAQSMKAMTPPSLDVKGGAATLTAKGFGMSAVLPKTSTSVKVGSFEGVAMLEGRVATPFASVQPASEGMSITRSYYLVREQGRKKLAEGDVVKVGDDIYVELELNAQAADKYKTLRSAYYVVEDGVPAGFVVLSEDKIYRAAPYGLPLSHEALKQRAFTPEKATFFFEEPAFWSDSPRLIGYVMRAQFAGKFSAPPATITDMYAAKVHGRTKAASFTIQ